VGGSMDMHARTAEQLFSAASAEFKRLDAWYFHNCLYEFVWQENRRRWEAKTSTYELLHTHPPDTKVVIVGDAAMSPYEVLVPGGAVEHWNEEAGAVWLQRFVDRFPALAWLNPEPERSWPYTHSNQLIREIIGERMFPLTVDGVERACGELRG